MNKKVFLDTNVLLDFFDSKREKHEDSKHLIYFLVRNQIKILFSEDMLSTIIYIAKGNKEAQNILISNIEKITYDPNIEICNFGEMVIRNASNYFLHNGGEYENILQYFCAEKNDCCAIYTNNTNFPKLKIPIKAYGEFDI